MHTINTIENCAATNGNITKAIRISSEKKMTFPLVSCTISAGFPSPADDYLESRIDLNKHLISHPAATFFVRVRGNSMTDAGISDGDMLIVDKALDARNNDIVLCILNSEFTVKRLKKTNNSIFLKPENSCFPTIEITDCSDFKIWGVVTYIIHKAK